jgi:hypothetical protein
MEHVRQGMMTLHTMLGGEGDEEEELEDEEGGGGCHDVDNDKDDDDDDMSRPERRRLRSRRGSSRSDGVLPRRTWYKGQWLDALDTVHQWLEATIVDVVLPSDVLSGYYEDDREGGEGTRRKDGDNDGRGDGMRGGGTMGPRTIDVGGGGGGRRNVFLNPMPW